MSEEGGESVSRRAGGVTVYCPSKTIGGFIFSPGLSGQSTGLECMKNRMRSLCVCSWAARQTCVCWCVRAWSLCNLAAHQ